MLSFLPCYSQSIDIKKNENDRVVFVYHIPDDEPIVQNEQDVDNEIIEEITSDDVTADTSPVAENSEENFFDEDDEYEIEDMYADVLKGYAAYNEGEDDEITLEDNEILVLNIKKPQRISAANYTQLQTTPLKFYNNSYSKYYTPEYSITPISSTNYKQLGGFKAGTVYNQIIDYGELEQTSGIFSSYQYKRFLIKTSYQKTVNTTNNNYNDNFYFSPEFKLNQYFTLKENFSADVTKRRKKAEIVISINPFGKRDEDRMKVEFGASQTYDDMTNTFKSQFRFATNFKL